MGIEEMAYTFEQALNELKAQGGYLSRDRENIEIDHDYEPTHIEWAGFATALKRNTTVTELSFHHVRISEEGMRFLADAVGGNTKLRTLTIVANDLTDEMVIALADGIKRNTNLLELQIYGDNPHIGDRSALALANALDDNQTLLKFAIDGCKVGNAGGLALAEAVSRSSSVCVFHFNGCDEIDDQTLIEMSKKLRASPHLVAASLGDESRLANGPLSQELRQLEEKTRYNDEKAKQLFESYCRAYLSWEKISNPYNDLHIKQGDRCIHWDEFTKLLPAIKEYLLYGQLPEPIEFSEAYRGPINRLADIAAKRAWTDKLADEEVAQITGAGPG